jgi:hypothetical protein
MLDTAIETRGEDFRTVAEFTVGEGKEVSFALSNPSATRRWTRVSC